VRYEDWEKTVPLQLRGDPLWSLRVYRAALYAGELAGRDGRQLAEHPATERVSGRLVSSVGSIGANIAEGYSRHSRRERANFYEYAVGSAREARDWYYTVRAELGEATVLARLSTLTAIAKVLLVLIDRTRGEGGGQGSGFRVQAPQGLRRLKP